MSLLCIFIEPAETLTSRLVKLHVTEMNVNLQLSESDVNSVQLRIRLTESTLVFLSELTT